MEKYYIILVYVVVCEKIYVLMMLNLNKFCAFRRNWLTSMEVVSNNNKNRRII
jgi:hypothetical protein